MGQRVAGHIRVAFGVSDTDAVTSKLAAAGATVIARPAPAPWESSKRTSKARLLRHPSYTGGLVAFFGAGIALDSWLSILALMFIPLLAVVVRTHVEEAELATALSLDTRSTPAVLVGWPPASGEASTPR